MEKLIAHTYHVGGMSCGGCATTVKNKLSAAKGVTSVNVDLGKKQAEINSSEEIKTETLQEALSKTHYTIADLERKTI
jgi:copper chaperone CopZ